MNPPWVEFPTIPMYSIGWRMGGGEDYIHAFHDWFGKKPDSEKTKYRLKNPEPETWEGWYETMVSIGNH